MKPVTVKSSKKSTAKTIPPAVLAGATPTARTPVAPTPTPVKVVAAPVKPVASPRATPPATTTIEARIDVGFGNRLFVRGQGAGLSWEQGVPLECVDATTWRLTVPAQGKLLFKLLLNDTVWAKGEDVMVTPGQRLELTPSF